jgi:uncharacterized protein (TIGR02246 family)
MTAFARSQDLLDAFAVAFNSKDTNALGALFTEDAELVNIRGARMRRPEGIVEGQARSFAGPLSGSRITLDSIDELKVTEEGHT